MSNLLENSAVALGFFDGVHLGHQAVIEKMLKMSKILNIPSCVVTFETHPIQLLRGELYPKIMSSKDRLKAFEKMGVENVLLLDFDKALLATSAFNYLEILKKSISPKIISVGFNHHFGSDKKGDKDFLLEHEKIFGYKSYISSPIKIKNDIVSSTLIKKLLQKGEIEGANTLLGHVFSYSGTVIKGRELGREIGFKTANIEPSLELIQLPNGVYMTKTLIDNKPHNSITNIGNAPTLKNNEKTIETHIFNFDKNIYNKEIEVFFIKKIRDEMKFESKYSLISQIEEDCNFIKKEFQQERKDNYGQ